MIKETRDRKEGKLALTILLDGPVITRTKGYSVSEAAAPGSSVTLTCTVDANPIELNNIRWFKDNEELFSSKNAPQWEKRVEGQEASILAKSIQRSDAGQYACEISNAYGNTRATIPLAVQCKDFSCLTVVLSYVPIV